MIDPKWLTRALEQARRDLIDLTRRNRLLNAPLEGSGHGVWRLVAIHRMNFLISCIDKRIFEDTHSKRGRKILKNNDR